ncbi:hypothetical protein GCM10011418_38060 [Sphingobacterium alkalisoli]|nr:hypothetical protein GCM10011418_38060 [Sphingobacterium alkalisoli]
MKKVRQIIERFPNTRTVGLQIESFNSSNFNTKDFSTDVKGEVNELQRAKIAVNLPVMAINRKFIATISGYYSQTTGDMSITPLNGTSINNDIDLKYWSGSLNTMYISSLFNNPTVFTGSLTGDGDHLDMRRIRGMITSTMILKRSPTENFSIGLIGIIDRSSRVPALPMVAYERHVNGSPWTFELLFPQKIFLERRISVNGLLFMGSEIFADRNYVTLGTDKLDGIYEFNEASIRSGLTYEHRFFGNLYLLFRGGISNPINARLIERNVKSSDYTLITKRNGSMYFNFGLSYNLF